MNKTYIPNLSLKMKLFMQFFVYLIFVVVLLLLIGMVFGISFIVSWNFIFICPDIEIELCGKYIIRSMLGAGIISIVNGIFISKILFFKIFPAVIKKYTH